MKIFGVFFSPTHGTRRVMETMTQTMQTELKANRLTLLDLTLPGGRIGNPPRFEPNDVLVLGMPVYGGRIPKLMREHVAQLKSEGSEAVIVGVYGNRDYDDILLEMKDMLAQNGFVVVAAGAFVGEHSMTPRLGTGRPDADDMAQLRDFAAKAATRVKVSQNVDTTDSVAVPGNFPYRADMPDMPIVPVTTEACYRCMICAMNCPGGAISMDDPRRTEAAKCIHCCACIKSCPAEAKFFDAQPIRDAVQRLEDNFMARRDPEIFL